jgi:hypothetical protein
MFWLAFVILINALGYVSLASVTSPIATANVSSCY